MAAGPSLRQLGSGGGAVGEGCWTLCRRWEGGPGAYASSAGAGRLRYVTGSRGGRCRGRACRSCDCGAAPGRGCCARGSAPDGRHARAMRLGDGGCVWPSAGGTAGEPRRPQPGRGLARGRGPCRAKTALRPKLASAHQDGRDRSIDRAVIGEAVHVLRGGPLWQPPRGLLALGRGRLWSHAARARAPRPAASRAHAVAALCGCWVPEALERADDGAPGTMCPRRDAGRRPTAPPPGARLRARSM
eukprot:scaffold7221_cov313-Prasinococcus_capsulatus_cf.AAC.1